MGKAWVRGVPAHAPGLAWAPQVQQRIGSQATPPLAHTHGRKGDALIFWSVRPDGKSFDPAAMHTACEPDALLLPAGALLWGALCAPPPLASTPTPPPPSGPVIKGVKWVGIYW